MTTNKFIVEKTNGRYLSSAIVNGCPSCAYVDDDGNLKFSRSSNVDGSGTWNVTQIRAVDSNIYIFPSLLVVRGHPALGFHCKGGENNCIYYIRSTNNEGSSWGVPIIVAAHKTASYLSLKNVSGNPSVAYLNDETNTIEYTRSSDGLGILWREPTEITQINKGGKYINLSLFNGYPVVSYFDHINMSLNFIKSNTNTGLCTSSIGVKTWNDPILIDDVCSGSNLSMTTIENKPFFSYFQIPELGCSTQQLKVSWLDTNRINKLCKTKPTIITPDAGIGPTVILNVNGKPIVVYINTFDHSINLAQMNNEKKWYTTICDNSSTMGDYLSALSINGKVGIFYIDFIAGNIQYIIVN